MITFRPLGPVTPGTPGGPYTNTHKHCIKTECLIYIHVRMILVCLAVRSCHIGLLDLATKTNIKHMFDTSKTMLNC